MTVMNYAGTPGIARSVQAEDDLRHFTPVGTLLGRIEQTEVSHEVALVVGRQLRAVRRAIIKGGCAHGRRL